MIIESTSLFALPAMLIVWAADTYLFLAGIRLLASRVMGARPSLWVDGLRQLTDGLPQHVTRILKHSMNRAVPGWLPWAFVMGSAVLVRYVLVWLLLRTA